jgi:hypothetical protein
MEDRQPVEVAQKGMAARVFGKSVAIFGSMGRLGMYMNGRGTIRSLLHGLFGLHALLLRR